MSIEKTIVPVLESQFPSFYREEGVYFVEFVKNYYKWMEDTGNTIYHARRLNEYRDINTTVDDFVEYFRKKYLYSIDLKDVNDKKLLFSNVKDFLARKGSEEGLKEFFRIFFGEEAQIFYPGELVLRPSHGQWVEPEYLEISISPRIREFVGRSITGVTSGATALVERVVRKGVTGKYFDVMYISNRKGSFKTNEIVTYDNVIQDSPTVIGSLTDVDIILTGANFEPGDIADVESNITGRRGKIRITEVETSTGRVTFTLIDGGWGFTTDALVYVSEKTMQTTARTNPLPLISVEVGVGGINYANGELITVTGGGGTGAAGYVTTDGFGTIERVTLTAKGTGYYEYPEIGVTTASGSGAELFARIFEDGPDFFYFETIQQPMATIDYYDAPNSSVLAVGTFVKGVNTACTSTGTGYVLGQTNVANSGANGTIKIMVYSGTFATASDIANSASNVALVDLYTNSTAYGIMTGSNSTFIGVHSVQGVFSANNRNYIKGLSSNTLSNVALIATGTGATFKIGAVQDTENIFVNTDLVGGNNVANVPYLSIKVEGSLSNIGFVDSVNTVSGGTGYTNGQLLIFTGGSPIYAANGYVNTNASGNIVSATLNETGWRYRSKPTVTVSGGGSGANLQAVMDYGYGFPKDLNGDLTSIINDVLTRENFTIGEIASITDINPGANYNHDPFVTVIEPGIAGFGRKDIVLFVDQVVGDFQVGERVIQSIEQPALTLEYTNQSTSISSVTIVNSGSGYHPQDKLSITGGGGSQANATITLGVKLGITMLTPNTLFVNEEILTQNNSLANGVAIFANSTTIYLSGTSGTFNVGNTVTGSSGLVANVTSVAANAIIQTKMAKMGYGYTSVPTVAVTNSTGGSANGTGASLTAVRSGFRVGEALQQNYERGVIETVSVSSVSNGSILVYTYDDFQANSTQMSTHVTAKDLTVAGPYTPGEQVIQIKTDLTVNTYSNTSARTTANLQAAGVTRGMYLFGEGILEDTYVISITNSTFFKVNKVIPITAQNDYQFGTVALAYVSNATITTVIDINGTFDTSNTLIGQQSGVANMVTAVGAPTITIYGSNTKADIVNITSAPIPFVSKGNVTEFANNRLFIDRRSFSVAFQPGTIQGSISGATAIVLDAVQNPNTRPIGWNANVAGDAGVISGTIKSHEVVDSGFAYEPDETVTISKPGSDYVGTGIVKLQTQGKGTGYFISERGFLNNRYLHDNNYYQDYSYVVQTGLTLAKYSDMLKKLMHVIGTRYFGEFYKVVSAETPVKTLTLKTGTQISNNSGNILYSD